jgi:hypothetical protein
MSTLIGLWFALAGVPAVLVGLAGIARVRRLRQAGVTAWALAVQQPLADGHRDTALQYRLADGRVLEKLSPATAKSGGVRPGQTVLIWYDPEDPGDVLVYGRERRGVYMAFAITGGAFILLGLAIAIFAL